MATGITGNYSGVYGNTYAALQQTAKKEETKEAAAAKQSSGTGTSNNDYLNQLAKLAPSVKVGIGNGFSTAKSGLTLTINPKLLEKMQNDPEQERKTMEMIRGVESMTKLAEGMNKASGWKTEFRHGYIDENGKYRQIALVKNEFGYKLSDKLRKERQENAEKLMEKSKEKSAKRKEELQKSLDKIAEKKKENLENTLEEKADEKETEVADKQPTKAEQLLNEKIAASKDGMIYLNDSEFRDILKAMREDSADAQEQPAAGANLDVRA